MFAATAAADSLEQATNILGNQDKKWVSNYSPPDAPTSNGESHIASSACTIAFSGNHWYPLGRPPSTDDRGPPHTNAYERSRISGEFPVLCRSNGDGILDAAAQDGRDSPCSLPTGKPRLLQGAGCSGHELRNKGSKGRHDASKENAPTGATSQVGCPPPARKSKREDLEPRTAVPTT
jgi:hypothetical protein